MQNLNRSMNQNRVSSSQIEPVKIIKKYYQNYASKNFDMEPYKKTNNEGSMYELYFYFNFTNTL